MIMMLLLVSLQTILQGGIIMAEISVRLSVRLSVCQTIELL